MKHIDDDNLIKLCFDLLDDVQQAQVQAHLDECASCQQRLDGLRKRFSVLDVLRDQGGVSGELVQQTLSGLGKSASRPRQRISVWIARAAAVLMVGFGVLIVNHQMQPSQQSPSRAVTEVSETDERAGGETSAYDESDERVGVAQERHDEIRAYQYGLDRVELPGVAADTSVPLAAAMDARVPELKQISEIPPPFAPASAIELNVLPRRENLQLTIYNSADLTLVREKRNLTLKRGWNWLQFMWANTLIDPTSLDLQPVDADGKVRVEQLVYPPRLKELGRWLLFSEVSGSVPFELTYFTAGLNWRATYQGTLSPDEQTMRLEGYVRVGNGSGEDYPDAQTRLLVGKVNLLDEIAGIAGDFWSRESESQSRLEWDIYSTELRRGQHLFDELSLVEDLSGMAGYAVSGQLKKKGIAKEGLSEYFLYTIEGRETIPNGWGKRLTSLEADDIPVESFYKYDEQRYGKETLRFVKFANDEEHQLGQTPIPDGQIRVFGQVGDDGLLRYAGQSSFKYIPVGEEVELNLGTARLVAVEPTLMGRRTGSYVFDDDGDVAGWDEWQDWRLTVKNTRRLGVIVEITRETGTAYWKIEGTEAQRHKGTKVELPVRRQTSGVLPFAAPKGVVYEKHDTTRLRFTVDVTPREIKELEYTLHLYHGRRQEEMSE